MRVAALAEVARVDTPLYPAVDVTMPHVQVFSNADDEMARVVRPAYAARVGRPTAISIVALPNGTVVRGDAQWMVETGDALVQEQVPPNWSVTALHRHRRVENPTIVELDGDVMLIARFGFLTWGHWLGELLPKIVVCERQQPGRFTYGLPRMAFTADRGLLARRLEECLAAYGVVKSRILLLDNRPLRFAKLFATTNVWTDRMMHPSVLADMRTGVGIEETERPVSGRRVALLRGDNDRRQIANAKEVRAVLNANGFEVVDIAEQSFLQQVRIFRTAETIFSILGSSLSGLIYACREVGVVAGVPDRFADRFFYAMMQARQARYAEVRGPVAGEPWTMYRDSTFTLPVAQLEQALDRLQAC